MFVKQSAGNNSISHRYREMIKACVEAATHEVQQKPYGDVVKYIVRAASIINQAVNDKARRFPHFNEVFVDARVIKEGTSAASEFIEADKMGTRFDLSEPALPTVCDSMFFNEAYVASGRESLSQENYRLRENNWFVFFQDYSGRIPGSIGVRDLDEGGLAMLAKMALEFAKCVGYMARGLTTPTSRSSTRGLGHKVKDHNSWTCLMWSAAHAFLRAVIWRNHLPSLFTISRHMPGQLT